MDPLAALLEKLNTAQLWEGEKVLERSEYLKVQGSTDTNIYFIKEGTLRIYVVDEFEEHTIRFGYQDNIIAALDSYITEQPSDIFIQALKKTEVWWISKKKYRDFILSDDENIQIWHQLLEQLVFQQLERERDILTSSPLERYQRVLARSPQLFQEVPHKYIANYLRMTPETLSRVKKG